MRKGGGGSEAAGCAKVEVGTHRVQEFLLVFNTTVRRGLFYAQYYDIIVGPNILVDQYDK